MAKGMGGMMGEGAPEVKATPSDMKKDVDVEPLAIVAVVAVVLGLALSFVPRKAGAAMGLAAGVAAIVLLFVLMFRLDSKLKSDMEEGMGAAKSVRPPASTGMPTGMPGMEDMMGGALEKSMGGMVELKAAFGFILANLCLAVAAALHVVALVQMGKTRAPA